MPQLQQKHLNFLTDIRLNNNREWFAENKPRFKEIHAEVKSFFQEVYDTMMETDKIERFHMHRIYRDLRFTKDKTPYKTHFSLHLARMKPLLRGGYYMRIKPGESMVAGGFWKPDREDLLRIRNEWAFDDTEIREILNSKDFKMYFGELEGNELKTGPRGFELDNPAIDLLKKKQYLARREFTDEEVLSENFYDEAIKTFMALRPWFDYMSEILTTDENGVSLYE